MRKHSVSATHPTNNNGYVSFCAEIITILHRNRRITSLLVLSLTATFCTFPLLLHASLPQSQDMTYHIFQADQFWQNLNHGVLYPRWAGGAVNGYGSPNFIFYSPLSYYFVALIHLFNSSLVSSMVITIWLSFFLSGITMFLLSSNFFPGYRALVPAVLYQILPFHLYELYLRGSFAALFSFIWFPLILLMLFKIHESSKSALPIVSLSFAYAALIMTHLVTAFLFSLLTCLVLLGFLIFRQFRTFIKTACAFACGLALSSVYFIPAFMECRYIHMEYLVSGPWGRYIDNFLFTKDKLHQDMSQFSHFYSLLHLCVVADLVLFVLILAVAKKRGVKQQRTVFTIFTASFVLTFLLTTPISKPLLYLIPGLQTLLFPWRWIAMMELVLAILSGFFFLNTDGAVIVADKIRNGSIILIYIALSAIIIWTTEIFPGEAVKRFEDPARFSYKMTPGVENIPIWARNWLEILRGSPPFPVSFVTGKGSYRVEVWEAQKRVVIFRSTLPSLVRISTFYYPGWEADLDGEKAGIAIKERTGAMLINIPEGEHVLKLIFGDTPLRVFSRYVSYFFCAILGFIVVLPFLKYPQSKGNNN